jgi:hypothetical protein
MFPFSSHARKTNLFALSWLFVGAAIVGVFLAGRNYVTEKFRSPDYLTVDEPMRDIGDIVVGDNKFLDFRIHNASNQDVLVHMIIGELC